MKTSITKKTSRLFRSPLLKQPCGLFIVAILLFQVAQVKGQSCSSCCIPAFPELTIYQSFQTGHGMGFGVEAGNWKKDAGKFSTFIGTSMVWANNNYSYVKASATQKQLLLSFYVKGQYKLTSHLYLIAAPGIVNLTYLEFQTGFRYVIPITRVIGIGIEPAYAFNQKQLLINANMHFALR
jgi:hypothetical protein